MASNDTLYMTLELKDNLNKQIQEDTKNVEKLTAAIKELNVDLKKMTAEKLSKNLSKNVNDAEKALYKLLEAKEKVDNALSRNMSMRQNGFLGMSDADLLRASARLDDIIDKVMNVGAKAHFSSSAVKDLLASLSSDVTIKSASSLASATNKELDKQEKERAKANKEATKEWAKAEDDAAAAAANNARNQDRVRDSLARIATARADLTAASNKASEEDRAHVQLLLSLLDQLAGRLNELKGQFLGERGALDGVLGSGYKGLMRNVGTTISDLNTSAAEEYRKKLIELSEAYEKHNREAERERQTQERLAAQQATQYQARQRAAQATRKQAEELVKLRMELLKTQAAELQGVLKRGRGVLGAEQYKEVQDALRAVREEMRQIASITQRLSSYSTKDLFGVGRGSTPNFSPLAKHADEAIQAANAMNTLTASERKFVESLSQASSSLRDHGVLLRDLQMMATQYLSLWGARSFLNNIIETGGLLEQQRLSIGAILGSMDKAEVIFGKIKDLAVKSPFGVVQLDTMSKQLTAYGFQYEELFDWTKRLADISAATGTEVSRLALALGHVRSEGALSGYTLRQFAMANVPLLQNLATNLGITTKEVRERTKKKEIGYDEVKKVLQDLTDEGGMFYNAQEVMSEALNAKFKNLRDAFDIMYGEVAESDVGDVLKGIAEALTAGAKEWKRFGNDILWVASAFGIAKTASAAYTAGMAVMRRELGVLAVNTKAFTASEVEQLVISGKVSRQQLLQAVATGRLSVEQAELAAATMHLSKAQLEQVATSKAVDKALLGNAIATSKLSIAELRYLATLRTTLAIGGKYRSFLTSMAVGFMGVGNAVKAAGAALRSFLPLLAIGAVVDIFSRWSQQKDAARESAEETASAITAQLGGIKSMYDSLSKRKPADLAAPVKEMTDALKGIGAYSSIQKEVEAADTLGGKYTILYEKTKELAKGYDEMKASVEAYIEAANRVGGGLLSDNMKKDIEQYGGAVIDEKVARSSAEHFSDIYTKELEKQLKKDGKWLESKMRGMDWLKLLGELSTGKQYDFAMNTLKPTRWLWDSKETSIEKDRYHESAEALLEFLKAMDATKAKREEVMNDMPRYIEYIKTAAETYSSFIAGLDVNKMSTWSDDDFKVYAEGVRQWLASLKIPEEVKEDLKEQFINSLPKDVQVKVRAALESTEAEEELKGWQADMQAYFDKHGINIKLSADDSIQSVEKKLQDARKKAQERMDSAGAILTYWKIKPDASAIEEFAKKHPFLAKIINAIFGDFTSAKKEVDTIDQVHTDTGLSVADPKKKNKKSGSGGKKEDTQLKKWKEEWSELKAFYSEYKKWAKEVGEDAALKKLRETGLWNQLFGADGNPVYDMRNWEKAIEQFEKRISGGTTDRDKFLFEVRKEKLSPQFDQAQDIVEAMLKRLDEELKKQGKEWNLYKKILDATGNRQMAAQMAFGEGISFKNQAEQLRKQIEDELLAAKLQDTVSVDELLGMDNKALKNIGIFEKSKILPMLKELKTVEQQLNAEEVELFLEVVKNAKSLETELDKITLKYDRLRDAVDKNVNISDDQKAQMKTNLDAEEARAKAAKQWEWFKKNDAEWGRVFGNLDKMSTNTLRKMRDKLKEIAPSIREDVEAMKALYEAMAKLDKAINSRNPFEAMGEALDKLSILRRARSESEASGVIIARGNQAAALGVKSGTKVTTNQIDDSITEAEHNFAESVSGISKAFNEIQGVLQPVIDLFDALGNEGLSKFFKAGSNAIGSAANVAGSFNTLSTQFSSSSNKSLQELGSVLGKAGPYGAAAAFALSVLSAVLAMHDKALQREIEASQTRQKEMENLTSRLEKALERAISGIYGFRSDEGALDRLDASLRYQSSGSIQDLIDYGKHGNSYRDYISEDTVKALDDAKKSRSYYDATYASLLAQRDELRHQYEMEDEKKKSDANRLNDYQNEIAEMDDQIKHFAEDMAKAIYGIDFKTWASELSETLVSAWSSGEDAAEAYRKKVSDILKDLGVKMITERFISKALEPIMEDFLKQYEQDEGVLTQDGMNILARMYDAGDTLVEQTNDFMDGLNSIARQHGADLEEAKESSSASSAIKGMTEQTADLLASYINAIRADVSVNRMTLQQILFAMQGQAEMPVIATAQLEQLRMIAQYTAATASNTARIDEIYSLLYENTLNANQFHVR